MPTTDVTGIPMSTTERSPVAAPTQTTRPWSFPVEIASGAVADRKTIEQSRQRLGQAGK
jgi:hypothetical protein